MAQLIQAADSEIVLGEYAVVNDKYMTLDTPVETLYEHFGQELEIEPVSQVRVMHDLRINDADFYEKIAPFERFMDEALHEKYEAHKLTYYASVSLKYNRDFLGDALLAISKELLQKNRAQEREILEMMFDEFYGLQYHVNSENRFLEYDYELEENYRYLKERAVALGIIKDKAVDFKTKHTPSSREIKFKRGLSQPMAIEAYKYDKNFTYKIAGEVLLEAMDNNVDAIIVEDADSFNLLRHHQKKIAKVVGREIDIEVVAT